ncbi:hypothetical protein P9112_008022 [Eukaryota sp. TZLM1-RC]
MTICHNKYIQFDVIGFITICRHCATKVGLCAYNEPFVTKMRLYLNIPTDQFLVKDTYISSNSLQFTLQHALKCHKLITHHSPLHDAVRSTVFIMARNARISCIEEPLLRKTLSLNKFGSNDRGDLYCDWIDNSEVIVDFVSCNVANDFMVHRRKLSPVNALEFKANKNIENMIKLSIVLPLLMYFV